jgi:hypothetical protein
MTIDTDATALRTQLEAIVKEDEEAKAKAVATRRRVQAARLLLEAEETKAAALEQAATAAQQRLQSSSSVAAPTLQVVPATSSSYEDTVVVGLHLHAATVLNVRQLVNIVFDSTNYASWHNLMEQALQRYALITHVTDDAPSDGPGWIQMDSIVLNWISNSISSELHQVVREQGCTARHLWLAIENQFLSNCEQRTLHLDAVFRNFVQGDLSVSEYYRKFKAMANGLVDIGSPIEDRILILSILRGLNQRFEHVNSIIRRYSPFPNFLNVQDDLLLEIHMDSTGPPATPTKLYTNVASPASKPPSSTPSHPLNGGNGGNWNKNNNKNRNSSNGSGNNGKNSNGGGGHNSSSGRTSTPTASDGRTGAPWPTYGNPWQGHMTVYSGPVPAGQQRP